MCRFPHYSLTEVQMKILNFFESYHLHDSLLENVEIDEAAKTVMLTVDFCFWQQDNYDSRKPENENTAIFLTIGQMCGCWKMYVNDQDEEKRKDYYIDDQNYKRDPLKAFDTDDENGITVRYDFIGSHL